MQSELYLFAGNEETVSESWREERRHSRGVSIWRMTHQIFFIADRWNYWRAFQRKIDLCNCEEVWQTWRSGKIYVLQSSIQNCQVNNAGGTNFASFGKGILDTSVDEFDQMMDLNVKQYVEFYCRECISPNVSECFVFRNSLFLIWRRQRELSSMYPRSLHFSLTARSEIRHKLPKNPKCNDDHSRRHTTVQRNRPLTRLPFKWLEVWSRKESIRVNSVKWVTLALFYESKIKCGNSMNFVLQSGPGGHKCGRCFWRNEGGAGQGSTAQNR